MRLGVNVNVTVVRNVRVGEGVHVGRGVRVDVFVGANDGVKVKVGV